MIPNAAEVKYAPRTKGVRFAPSPTGRFHIGNLRTAWISYQWAQKLRAPWVVRFEDIDLPRRVPGAREKQIEDMEAIGLKPNDPPNVLLIQSELRPRHWKLFCQAIQSGQVYPCDCSRKDVQAALAGLASAPHDGLAPVYSGACRPLDHSRSIPSNSMIAWRFKMPHEHGMEDFIVARSAALLNNTGLPTDISFVPSYHWACAIDDFDGDYNLLVRSVDLKPAAILQRAIQKWLGELEGSLRIPAIFHTSLVVQNDGNRLEKRTPGATLDEIAFSPTELVDFFSQSFDTNLLDFDPSQGALSEEKLVQLSLAQLLKT